MRGDDGLWSSYSAQLATDLIFRDARGRVPLSVNALLATDLWR